MHIRTPSELGLVIRQRRRSMGLNQTELAARIGVGRQWVVAIEHGKQRAELGLVLRALAALDLALSVDGEDPKQRQRETPTATIDLDAIVNAATYHVVPNPGGGWDVRRGGSEQAVRHFDNKETAVEHARNIGSAADTDLDNRDGGKARTGKGRRP